VKEVPYAHLDISIRNFKQHSPKQWELIHEEFAQLFLIDPSLKIGVVEKYVQVHLSQARQKWKKMWKIGGEMARHEDCLVDVLIRMGTHSMSL